MRWHSANHLRLRCNPLTHFFKTFSSFLLRSCSDGLYVVSRQHPLLAGALHSSVHPSLVDLLNIHDQVAIQERHLVLISCGVVVHRSVALLQHVRRGMLGFERSECVGEGVLRVLRVYYPRAGRRGGSGLTHGLRLIVIVLRCCWGLICYRRKRFIFYGSQEIETVMIIQTTIKTLCTWSCVLLRCMWVLRWAIPSHSALLKVLMVFNLKHRDMCDICYNASKQEEKTVTMILPLSYVHHLTVYMCFYALAQEHLVFVMC